MRIFVDRSPLRRLTRHQVVGWLLLAWALSGCALGEISVRPVDTPAAVSCANQPATTQKRQTGIPERGIAKGAQVPTYNQESNTITIPAGDSLTLPGLGKALATPKALRETKPGEWLLAANLVIERHATLRIAAPEVQRLRLQSDDELFVSIKALGGDLTIEGVCVTSWDPDAGAVDLNYDDGRSFILARNGARMTIRNAELSYLGYAADESYGLAYRLSGTTGEVSNSRLGYNYYGLYTYEVADLVIRNNEVHHSILYGIDPHTDSRNLLIEGNTAHHNGKHGIILAERCTDSIIRGNRSYANALHGIVLYQQSNNNLVENNITYENGLEGININNSSNNTIRGNESYRNTKAGIGVGQKSSQMLITGNRLHGNQEDGIALYSKATNNTIEANDIYENTRYGIYLKSEGNRITTANRVYRNRVGIYLNVEQPSPISESANQIHDNQDGNIKDNS